MAKVTKYYKDGKEVVRPRSLVHNNNTYLPPSDELLIELGYEIKEVEYPDPVPYVPTYEERVVNLIRERYTMDDELAILRQRDSKHEEFIEYNEYCEDCKRKAKGGIL